MKTYTVIDNETGRTLTGTAIILGYWDRESIAERLMDYEDTDGGPQPTPELIDKTCEAVIRIYEQFGDFPDAKEIIVEYRHLRRMKADAKPF